MSENREKVLSFLEAHPGSSSSLVSKKFKGDNFQPVAILTYLARLGEVFRCKDRKGRWIYYAHEIQRDDYINDLEKNERLQQWSLVKSEEEKNSSFRRQHPTAAAEAELRMKRREESLRQREEWQLQKDEQVEQDEQDEQVEQDEQDEQPSSSQQHLFSEDEIDRLNREAGEALYALKRRLDQEIEEQRLRNEKLQKQLLDLQEQNKALEEIKRKKAELAELQELGQMVEQEIQEVSTKYLNLQQEVLGE